MDLASSAGFFFVAYLLLFATVITVKASIHIYDKDAFREIGNVYLLAGGSEGIVSSTNVASSSDSSTPSSSIHDGRSYIKFENITFWRGTSAAEEQSDVELGNALVQIILFEAADRNDIGGSAYGGQRAICCTSDLAKVEGCKQGEVIKRPSATNINWPIVLSVKFEEDDLSTTMNFTEISIKKTGIYNLFFVSCEPKLKGMVMSGKTVWKNPDGYLPGRMAPLKEFYVFMVIAYLVLSIAWFFQYVRFWDDVLLLQHWVTSMIALGLLEMILWYFEYVNFNNTGMRPVAITTWVVTVGAVKKTISRLLILSISMGYGVVRPTLGGLTSKVLVLGITCLVASELLDITEHVGTINDVSGRAKLILVLPYAFLDAFLIVWIFTSLSKTLELLQAKRSSVKLDIYRKFSNALVVTVISSVAWIGYEIYFKATDPFNERWESAWIITAFWDVLAFGLLCVLCYLWAPSQSSQRYAYSEDVGDDSDDEETRSLTRNKIEGDISLVKQERDDTNDDTSDQENSPVEDKRS